MKFKLHKCPNSERYTVYKALILKDVQLANMDQIDMKQIRKVWGSLTLCIVADILESFEELSETLAQHNDIFSVLKNQEIDVNVVNIDALILQLNTIVTGLPNDLKIKSYEQYTKVKNGLKYCTDFANKCDSRDSNIGILIMILGVRLTFTISQYQSALIDTYNTQEEIINKCKELIANIKIYSNTANAANATSTSDNMAKRNIDECKFLFETLFEKLDATSTEVGKIWQDYEKTI